MHKTSHLLFSFWKLFIILKMNKNYKLKSSSLVVHADFDALRCGAVAICNDLLSAAWVNAANELKQWIS